MKVPDLVCVPPKEVQRIWGRAEPLIRAAILQTGLSAWRDIEYDILYGDALLWLALTNGEIDAAAATSLQDIDAGRVCVITACGGANMQRWLPLLDKIEAYAKDEHCILIRIFGRTGWKKVLKGFHETNVVLDKEIT
jgi:hypothetical protein